jgi:hypothetical protein
MMNFNETFGSRIGRWVEQNLAEAAPDEIDGSAKNLNAQLVIEAAIRSSGHRSLSLSIRSRKLHQHTKGCTLMSLITIIGRGHSGTRAISHTLYASGVYMGRHAERIWRSCCRRRRCTTPAA